MARAAEVEKRTTKTKARPIAARRLSAASVWASPRAELRPFRAMAKPAAETAKAGQIGGRRRRRPYSLCERFQVPQEPKSAASGLRSTIIKPPCEKGDWLAASPSPSD